ncbi:MAG TPA: response regulator [Phycisphaerae bacterium]|nr:response regulator transcription factor [Phycisphaerales bacterium]HRX84016.1 response regulator [Phycisphaerae bacterium]
MNADLLIVDADPHLTGTLAQYLEGYGFTCRIARDGAEALAEVDRCVPDVLILDRALRRMSGDELGRLVRANPRSQHVPMIIVSHLDPAENPMFGFDVSADDYLRKPFSAALLLERIRTHLDSLAAA